jgi:hypothetical protein
MSDIRKARKIIRTLVRIISRKNRIIEDLTQKHADEELAEKMFSLSLRGESFSLGGMCVNMLSQLRGHTIAGHGLAVSFSYDNNISISVERRDLADIVIKPDSIVVSIGGIMRKYRFSPVIGGCNLIDRRVFDDIETESMHRIPKFDSVIMGGTIYTDDKITMKCGTILYINCANVLEFDHKNMNIVIDRLGLTTINMGYRSLYYKGGILSTRAE